MSFQDQVVVITGASAGVGAETARAFFAAGSRLVLAARGQAGLDRIAAELGEPERLRVVACDVREPEDCRRLIDEAVAAFGRIDVLVNNAGCNHRGAVEEVAAEDLAEVIEVNLRAPVLLSRHALEPMRAAGRGVIVNVASLAGRVPLPHEATYSATKFGLRGFSLALAEELRGSGITVSVVSPGPIATGFILEDPTDVPDIVFSQPMSTAAEVAAAIMACARDGRRERPMPASSGLLTTVAYLAPGLSRALRPLLERKGARVKQRYLNPASGRKA